MSETPLPRPRLFAVGGTGPEDVVVDEQGRVFAGVEDGRILRLDPEGGRVEVVVCTGGRPLGIELLDEEWLLVCDARRGLLRVPSAGGQIEVLVDQVSGQPLVFCNNAAVGGDGTVYFSDSSRRFGIDYWQAELLEHSGTGRLLRRDPAGNVEVVLDGLQMANGVALASDESYVAVAETGAYRLVRRWLAGPRAGKTDVLIDNLPGFPDNISTGSDGLIWIALPSPRNPQLDGLLRMHPVFRQLVWALPPWLQPKPKRTIWVMAVDDAGRVVHDLQAPGDEFHMVTGVREKDGKLYLGSLTASTIALLDLV